MFKIFGTYMLNKYIKCNFGGQRCGTSTIVDVRRLKVKLLSHCSDQATGWTIRGWNPCRGKIFISSKTFIPAPGSSQCSIQLIPGLRCPEREAKLSNPSVAEVTNDWFCTCPLLIHECLYGTISLIVTSCISDTLQRIRCAFRVCHLQGDTKKGNF